MTAGVRDASVRRVAAIDLEAFAANLSTFLGDGDEPVFDARANAYGHGAAILIPVALDVGVTTIRVSPAQFDEPWVPQEALTTDALTTDAQTTESPSRRLIGAEAYGMVPGTRAIMTLTGEVIAVKEVPANSGVSYGYSYRTAERTTLALIALGYADGIPRLASNRASVFVSGAVLPVVGRVAMDQLVVDCGANHASVGDEAVIFGDATNGYPTAGDWAAHAERTALELTANLGARIARVPR